MVTYGHSVERRILGMVGAYSKRDANIMAGLVIPSRTEPPAPVSRLMSVQSRTIAKRIGLPSDLVRG